MNDLLFIGHPKEENLALFAGGELGPLARWRIEQHLEKCPACQDVVADFFHLHSSVSELAELPQIDWNELAQDIQTRVRIEAAGVEESKGGWFAHHPWQVGLATAALLCTVVVVRQLPMATEGLHQSAPSAVSESLQVQKQRLPDSLLSERAGQQSAGQQSLVEPEQRAANAPQQSAPSADAAANAADSSRAEADRLRRSAELAYSIPTRQDESASLQTAAGGPLSPDLVAPAPPAEQKEIAPAAPLRQMALSEEKTAARERNSARYEPLGDVKRMPAPAAPPAPSVAPQKENADAAQEFRADVRAKNAAPAGFSGASANEQPKAERSALTRPGAVATLGALRGQPQGLMKKADANSVLSAQRGFTVLPAALEDPNVDVGVAADGWISVRSVDGNTGTITITDVYVP